MSFGLCIGEPRLNSEFCILTVKCHRPIIDPPLKQLAPHSRGGEEAATADEVVEEEETRRDAAAAIGIPNFVSFQNHRAMLRQH